MKKRILSMLLVAAAIGFAACAKNESVKLVNSGQENIAMQGYDTMAYFNENMPKEGKPEFAFDWNGAKWHFSTAENRDLFAKSPEKYAPQFGGYCAWAVSSGYTADGDPNAWSIVNGKLYLNYNQKVKEKWETEQDRRIKDAEKNWEDFKVKMPEHKG